MIQPCEQLGMPLSTKKAEGPSTKLEFLGIDIGILFNTLSLPTGNFSTIIVLILS